MKKIVLVVIEPPLLFSSVSTYQVNIETPDTLTWESPSFSLSPTVPAMFDTPIPDETPHAPVSPLMGILATGITGFWWFRRI